MRRAGCPKDRQEREPVDVFADAVRRHVEEVGCRDPTGVNVLSEAAGVALALEVVRVDSDDEQRPDSGNAVQLVEGIGPNVAMGKGSGTDDGAPGNLDDPTDPAYNQSAQILTGRLKYELYGESYVGALVTNREFLDTHSRLVALDGNFRYGRNYATQYKLLFTNHRDASGIVKKGYFIDLMARKSGRHFSWMFATNQLSPDFKTAFGSG